MPCDCDPVKTRAAFTMPNSPAAVPQLHRPPHAADFRNDFRLPEGKRIHLRAGLHPEVAIARLAMPTAKADGSRKQGPSRRRHDSRPTCHPQAISILEPSSLTSRGIQRPTATSHLTSLDRLEVVAMSGEAQSLPSGLERDLVADKPVRPHAGLVDANDQTGVLPPAIAESEFDADLAIRKVSALADQFGAVACVDPHLLRHRPATGRRTS